MKKYIIIFAIIVIAGISVAYFLYNKPHENIGNATPDIEISASELFANYEQDEPASNTKYLGKTIQVTGIVKEVTTENDITIVVLESESMMFGVRCELDPHSTHQRIDFNPGESVTLKGKCSGMLADVVLVRCVEVSKE